MVTTERKSEILRLLHDAVVAFDEELSSNLCRQALAEGIDPYDMQQML